MSARNPFMSLLLSLFVLSFWFGRGQAQSEGMEDVIPGAQIGLQVVGGSQTVRFYKVDQNGIYTFSDVKAGTYRLVCKLPGSPVEWAKKARAAKPQHLFVNFKVEGTDKGPITLGSKTGKNPLCFESPEFRLPSNIHSLECECRTSVNNYGINDEGIK